jgi:hypothetical protein
VTLNRQLVFLFVLAIPIASIAWTVTHEDVFREPHDWCLKKSKTCRRLLTRKVFYLFTCEYCFSHYVTAVILFITRYKLLFDDWRGYLIAGFSLVWVANVYMSFFGRLRLQKTRSRSPLHRRKPRPSYRSASVASIYLASCFRISRSSFSRAGVTFG